MPGLTATKPGAAMTPFPGIAVDIIDNDGRSVGNNEGGYLVITKPWPGMLRSIWGDDERYRETYWSTVPGAATSPATGPNETRTAASGCWDGWTTS